MLFNQGRMGHPEYPHSTLTHVEQAIPELHCCIILLCVVVCCGINIILVLLSLYLLRDI